MIFLLLYAQNQFSCIQIEASIYSKVGGDFNPLAKPDPIHICKIHEHDDPLVQFMHDEILKFGNVTKVCSAFNISIHELNKSLIMIFVRHVH